MGNESLLLENAGSHISLNCGIIEARRYIDEIDDKLYWKAGIAYEVVRVIGGVPMFFEDHVERLNASLAKMDAKTETSADELLPPITSLLRANGAGDCNVKIQASAKAHIDGAGAPPRPDGSSGPIGTTAPDGITAPAGINLLMNINKSFYPPPEYYSEGVPVGLYAYTREAPNVKRVVTGFKEQVKALMESGGVFELLLYDSTHRLTEGSRSNLFFTRGDQLFTAPDRIILKGTIRKYAFLAAERAGIEIVERPVTLEEIGLSPGSLGRRRAHGGALSGRSALEEPAPKQKKSRKTIAFPTPGPWPGSAQAAKLPELTVNGAFITGTSIGILPISRIGGVRLDSAGVPAIRKIRYEYEKIAREYINSHTNQ